VPELNNDVVSRLDHVSDGSETTLAGVGSSAPSSDGIVDDWQRKVLAEVLAPSCSDGKQKLYANGNVILPSVAPSFAPSLAMVESPANVHGRAMREAAHREQCEDKRCWSEHDLNCRRNDEVHTQRPQAFKPQRIGPLGITGRK
jgi:hypothetical protein